MSPIGMTLVFVVFLGAFAWSAVRRWKLLMVGGPEPRFSIASAGEIGKRLEQTFIYAFAQKKMPKNSRYRVAGLAHVGIFVAFQVLLLNSVLLWIRGFDADFDFWGILAHGSPIGIGYSVVKELSAFAAIVGSLVFVYYRVVEKPKRMSLGFEGLLILFIIITMMLADYVYVGGDIVRDARMAATGARGPLALVRAVRLRASRCAFDGFDATARWRSSSSSTSASGGTRAGCSLFLNLLPLLASTSTSSRSSRTSSRTSDRSQGQAPRRRGPRGQGRERRVPVGINRSSRTSPGSTSSTSTRAPSAAAAATTARPTPRTRSSRPSTSRWRSATTSTTRRAGLCRQAGLREPTRSRPRPTQGEGRQRSRTKAPPPEGYHHISPRPS